MRVITESSTTVSSTSTMDGRGSFERNRDIGVTGYFQLYYFNFLCASQETNGLNERGHDDSLLPQVL